ncbi:hypothetical protein F4827_003027 [Paraburkholderia bannensis]|uniref:Uncharacterized protein n=1 Tax=Paraburkholderia bannensis TaxID=765414 RepID=A0A7W9TXD5_9BURK|nr:MULTISPECIES: hypothetical protein [Paraburkholderia]MBB3258159.1 hypothetical protein [Paraburkholderia sp. WP4_3_2]MBB6103172.1 hypothetical protein [Paraburkholderia bannensis]
MKTTEFMFRFPGNGNEPAGNEPARYSVIVVHGVSATFIRIGAAVKPFSLMVTRVRDETFAHARAEDLARLAIAQAIYTGLFEAHPQGAVDLEVHGPLWDGELETGQWQHGMAKPAPEVQAIDAAPVARAFSASAQITGRSVEVQVEVQVEAHLAYAAVTP